MGSSCPIESTHCIVAVVSCDLLWISQQVTTNHSVKGNHGQFLPNWVDTLSPTAKTCRADFLQCALLLLRCRCVQFLHLNYNRCECNTMSKSKSKCRSSGYWVQRGQVKSSVKLHCTVQIHCTMQCTLYIFTVQIHRTNSLYKFPVQSTVHCTRVEEAISPFSSGGGRATFGETIWRRQLNIWHVQMCILLCKHVYDNGFFVCIYFLTKIVQICTC